jgi:hypothetical protein
VLDTIMSLYQRILQNAVGVCNFFVLTDRERERESVCVCVCVCTCMRVYVRSQACLVLCTCLNICLFVLHDWFEIVSQTPF